jgi:hypothetical protein
MESLFPGRDANAGTDARFDALLAEVFREPIANPALVDTTRSAHAFAIAQGWPLPQAQERSKWLRCVLVILGALLATLLLGRVLEGLRMTDQRTPVAKAKVSSIAAPVAASDQDEPADSSVEVSGPVLKNPFADWAPRAVLVRLPAPRAQLVALPVRRAELVWLPR